MVKQKIQEWFHGKGIFSTPEFPVVGKFFHEVSGGRIFSLTEI